MVDGTGHQPPKNNLARQRGIVLAELPKLTGMDIIDNQLYLANK